MAITEPFFANRAEKFYGNSGDYYLSISFKEFWFWAFKLSFLIFLGPVGALKGRGPTDTHMGLGPQNPNKKLAHLVDPFGHLLLSRNYVRNYSDIGPPS